MVFGAAGVAVAMLAYTFFQPSESSANAENGAAASSESLKATEEGVVVFPKSRWKAAAVAVEPVESRHWEESLSITGSLELNQDRVAHVHVPVQGVVRQVAAGLGGEYKAGDVLAVIDSREVGQAKLELVKNRLELHAAQARSQWIKTIRDNAVALIEAMECNQTIPEIEQAFRDRPLGSYREELVSAYANKIQTGRDATRLEELHQQGVVPDKDYFKAKAQYEAAAATLQSKLEYIRFETRQQLLNSDQEVRRAQTAMSVSESQLVILGFTPEQVRKMDPLTEGDRLSHYNVLAPFDGTVLKKDLALAEHVSAETELLEFADLSTLWLRANVFEKDVLAVQAWQDQDVEFTVASVPDKAFKAKVFSTGSVVDDQSRTASLLAVYENADRRLKPGMFVNVKLAHRSSEPVVCIPATALLRHENQPFVFVARGDEEFERRNVTVGRTNASHAEILSGLAAGESLAVQGGFALKSEMLRGLLSED